MFCVSFCVTFFRMQSKIHIRYKQKTSSGSKKRNYNIQAYYKTLMQKTLYLRLLCVSVFLSVRESVLLCVEKLNIILIS